MRSRSFLSLFNPTSLFPFPRPCVRPPTASLRLGRCSPWGLRSPRLLPPSPDWRFLCESTSVCHHLNRIETKCAAHGRVKVGLIPLFGWAPLRSNSLSFRVCPHPGPRLVRTAAVGVHTSPSIQNSSPPSPLPECTFCTPIDGLSSGNEGVKSRTY